MASEDKVQKEALELLQEEVDLARTSLHIVAEKISNMELRQSVSSGLGNDAIRAMHQWAVAESASLSSMAVSTVVNMIEAGRKATYYENFMHKDLRRGQFEVCKLFSPSDHEIELRPHRESERHGRDLHHDAMHTRGHRGKAWQETGTFARGSREIVQACHAFGSRLSTAFRPDVDRVQGLARALRRLLQGHLRGGGEADLG